MTTFRYLFVLMLFAAIVQSCKHHPTIFPFDPGDTSTNPIDTTDTTGTETGIPCSPDTIYFQNDILPLLNTYCAMPGLGCHDIPTDDNDDIVFNNYANVMNLGDIDPFNPGNSEIYEKITESDPDDRMPPPPYPALSPEQIQMIYTWIMQGAQNNHCDCDPSDTTNLTFALDIQPILENKCVGCHGVNSVSDNVNLTTYQGVVNAQQDNSRLQGAVNWWTGYAAMPYNKPKLPDCEVAKINAWINAGMQQ
jgi:mono/diheme cytochrome c family protein